MQVVGSIHARRKINSIPEEMTAHEAARKLRERQVRSAQGIQILVRDFITWLNRARASCAMDVN